MTMSYKVSSSLTPLVPNAETTAAIEEARTSSLPKFDGVQCPFDDLNAEDREDVSIQA